MSSDLISIVSQFNFNMPNLRHNRIYEFEDFRLDATHLLLYQNEQQIPLAPKVIETLLALVERHGEVLSKVELMEIVWADSIVEEGNLSQNLYLLRKTLGKTANGKPLIETLHRRGYRFNGDVRCIAISEKELTKEIPIQTHQTKSKISSQSRLNVERKGNILALADWQTERENQLDRNLAAQTNGETFSPFVLPVLTTETENKIASPARTSRRRILLITIAAAAFGGLLILAGFAFLNSKNKQSLAAKEASAITLKRLTPDQNAIFPTLSPDGKYLAYFKRENTTGTLWLKDMASGSAVQIMPDGTYFDLAFSPDGTQIYYNTGNIRDHPNGTLYRIPIFGGKPQEVLRNVISPLAISPDGKQIAVVKGDVGFTVIDENGKEAGNLLEPLGMTFYPVSWGSQMSWSPDGERVVLCGKGDDGLAKLLEFSVKERTARFVSIPNFSQIDDAIWLADGAGLLVTAKEKEGEPYQIWRVAYPSGKAVRVTHDFNDYDWISLTQDSKTLVVQQSSNKTTVWLAPFGEAENARQLTFGSEAQDGYFGLAFAPDGKIIFTSPRSGNVDLWQMNADGSNQQPLTADEGSLNISPRFTPDGRYIVFVSSRNGGAAHLWRMDADGRNPLQLTGGATGYERAFEISADGNQVYYVKAAGLRGATFFRISIEGGEPVELTDSYESSGTIAASPDGKLLARYLYLNDSKQPWKLGVFPVEGGEPIKLLNVNTYRGIVRWSSDGKSLVYIKSLTSQLWRQPIDGSPPTMLMDFKNDWLFNFAFSPDYKQIVLARGNEFSEAILIDNFGKNDFSEAVLIDNLGKQ